MQRRFRMLLFIQTAIALLGLGLMGGLLVFVTSRVIKPIQRTAAALEEAAHAGQYGHGFAVVANEIRSLAEKTTQQSKATGSSLKSIKTLIDNVAGTSAEAGITFNAVLEMIMTVNRLSEISGQVRESMTEMKTG